MVNRALDYGFNWTFYKQDDVENEENNDSIIFRQLKYFYEKDKDKKGYIKALYLHHLLDFFKETYVDIYDINLVFEKFVQNKVIIEISKAEGKKINFEEDLKEIFKLLKDNKKELYEDLRRGYKVDLENSKNKK